MKSIKHSIYVYQRSEVGKDGRAGVNMKITITREKPHVENLNIRVKPDYWLADKCEVSESCPDASDLNMQIRNARARANEIFVRWRLMNRDITIGDFKKEYPISTVSRESFLEFWKRRMDYDFSQDVISANTYKSEKTTYNIMERVSTNLLFRDLNADFLIKFDKDMKKAKKAQNTRWNYFKHISKYCTKAVAAGLMLENPCTRNRPASAQGGINACTQDEVKALVNYYYSAEIRPAHAHVLQHFLFSCFVGARISDIRDFTPKNIVNGELVYSPVKLRRRKPRIVRVPLHDMAKQFLEQNDKIFIKLYEVQAVNRILKKIQISCNIDTNLSTHVARHTFATIFLERGGKVEVLQQLLGHANIRDTMKYVHVAESRKAEQIKVFDGFMDVPEKGAGGGPLVHTQRT